MPKPKLKPSPYKFLPLPGDFNPLIITVNECCAYARQSRWTTFQKIRQGRYRTSLTVELGRSSSQVCAKLGSVNLIIVDPLVSVARGDSHKNAETRGDL
jgi:hypothetical protein